VRITASDHSSAGRVRTFGLLLLLTIGALFVHGYHPFAEDAEIYLPGIKRILHPQLFPAWSEFFTAHAQLTFFPNLIALSLRITHLPLNTGLFIWHLISIFLLLLACFELSALLFSSEVARWGGVCLVASLLTIPVAGTALYILDQYLNPRNLAALASVFVVVRVLETKYLRAALWLAFAACVHPLMWFFPFIFSMLLIALEKFGDRIQKFSDLLPQREKAALVCVALPAIPFLHVPSAAYQEAAKLHPYFFIQNWAWYEWLGIAAPLALFCWFARIARIQHRPQLQRLSLASVIYGVAFLFAALAIDLPHRFEALARLQPLRCLHLLYIFMFIVIGGLVSEYILKNHLWRWLLLFAPLLFTMFLAQRALFPASAHIEWPGGAPTNRWAQAFLWVRNNTPVDALFALNPEYMHIPGEDEIGFRALAERSRLADWVKDNGAVSMFPQMADEWQEQVQAQTPWPQFQLADFLRLKRKYGVSWVVLQQPGISGLDCEFQNSAVKVCRIP